MKPVILVFVACVLGCVVGVLSTGSRPSQESRDATRTKDSDNPANSGTAQHIDKPSQESRDANRATGSNSPVNSGTTKGIERPSQESRDNHQVIGSNKPLNSGTTQRIETESQLATDKTPVSPAYEVVETKDYSLPNRRRLSIKVVINDRRTDYDLIQAMLLDVARSQNADAVLAYAYWPGDDWQDLYTAGMLEWGKNGRGWASNSHILSKGEFHARESPVQTFESGARRNPMTDKALDVCMVKDFMSNTLLPFRERIKDIDRRGGSRLCQPEVYSVMKKLGDALTRARSAVKIEDIRRRFETIEEHLRPNIDQSIEELPVAKAMRDLDALKASAISPSSNGRLDADPANPSAGEIHEILVPLGYKLGDDGFYWQNGTTSIYYDVEGLGLGTFHRRLTRLMKSSPRDVEWGTTRIRINGVRVYSVNSYDEQKELDLNP